MSTAVLLASTDLASLGAAAPVTAIPGAVRRGAWQLAAGHALSLRASQPSLLRLRQGRVWVTRDATRHAGSEDLVIGPGESLRVEAGERIVMEPWDRFGATYTWDAAGPDAAR